MTTGPPANTTAPADPEGALRLAASGHVSVALREWFQFAAAFRWVGLDAPEDAGTATLRGRARRALAMLG